MKPPKLTAADWVEIYYALDSKRLIVDQGDAEAEWIAHLERILRKIGPDGKNMTGGK